MKVIDKLAHKYALNINQLRGPTNPKIIDFKNLNMGFYDDIAKNDSSIKKNKTILKKVKDSSMKEFIYTNKDIPERWKHRTNYGNDILNIMTKDKNLLKYVGASHDDESNKNKISPNKKINFFITKEPRNENEKELPTINNKKYSSEKVYKIKNYRDMDKLEDSEKKSSNIKEENANINEHSTSKITRQKNKSNIKKELSEKEINNILEDFKISYPIKDRLKELYDKTNYYHSKTNLNISSTKNRDKIMDKENNLTTSVNNLNKTGIETDQKFTRSIFYNTIKNQQIFKRKNVIRQNVFNNLVKNDIFTSKSTTNKISRNNLNPIVFSNYNNFIKKLKVKSPLVNKNLENINFYGPYFSYCPPGYNKNIEYYNNLEINQCLGLLHHIKKLKITNNKSKKNEFDKKVVTFKENISDTVN